jgi:hypothetical protein
MITPEHRWQPYPGLSPSPGEGVLGGPGEGAGG